MTASAGDGRGWAVSFKRLAVAMAVVATTTLVSFAAPFAASQVGAVGSDWQVSASYPVSPNLNAISCPTTSDCFAVGKAGSGGESILATTDGGATWNEQTPGSDLELNAISCTSASDCVAVGGQGPGGPVVLETDDGGSQWINAWQPIVSVGSAQPSALYGLTCTSGFNCVAVGSDTEGNGIIATISNAHCCSLATTPSGVGPYYGVSCPSATTCFVTADNMMVTTTDGGLSWADQTIPTELAYQSDVTCASPSDCIAVAAGEGANVLTTTDGGATWVEETVPADVTDLVGISCAPSTSDCYAVGQIGTGSDPNGAIVASTDGGVTWTSQTVPDGQGALAGVDCADAADCFAVGGLAGGIVATTDSGTTWTSDAIPMGFNQPYAIACPSSTTCFTVGNGTDASGGILTTSNGGATWTAQSAPPGAVTLYGIACPSVSDCTAVGYDDLGGGPPVVIGTTDGGTTWGYDTTPSGLGTVSAVSCPSVTSCFVVGTAADSTIPMVIVSTDDGATWTTETVPSTDGSFSSISCASPLDCQALGDFQQTGTNTYFDLLGTSDGGAIWTLEPFPAGNGPFSVACPSVSDCYLLGQSSEGAVDISTTTNGGGSWVTQSVPTSSPYEPYLDPDHAGGDIFCLSVSICYADVPGTTSSTIVATNDAGADWTSGSVPSAAGPLSGIACPSATECFAIGLGYFPPDDGGLILSGSLPSVTSASLPSGRVGSAYSAELAVGGGQSPYSWSITSGTLPPGLSLDASTGTLSGTPTSAGTQNLTFEVTDSNGVANMASTPLPIAKGATTTTVSTSPKTLSHGASAMYSAQVTSSGAVPSRIRRISYRFDGPLYFRSVPVGHSNLWIHRGADRIGHRVGFLLGRQQLRRLVSEHDAHSYESDDYVQAVRDSTLDNVGHRCSLRRQGCRVWGSPDRHRPVPDWFDGALQRHVVRFGIGIL